MRLKHRQDEKTPDRAPLSFFSPSALPGGIPDYRNRQLTMEEMMYKAMFDSGGGASGGASGGTGAGTGGGAVSGGGGMDRMMMVRVALTALGSAPGRLQFAFSAAL